MPISPSDGHRTDVFHWRTMLLVGVASLVLLVLGRWGLSFVSGSAAEPSVEDHVPPVVPEVVTPAPEIPRENARKLVPPPPAQNPEGAALADKAGDPDTGAPIPAAAALAMNSHLSARSQAVVAKLLEARKFALGGVGFAGTMSAGEELTRYLAHRPDAIAAFDWLANQHRPAAQLYAYWALRTLAPDHARAHATELHHDRRRVMAFHGCIGSEDPVSDLVREVEHRAKLAL